MTLPQSKLREAVFYILFSLDFMHDADEELLSMVMDQLKISKKHAKEAMQKAIEVLGHKETLDQLLRGRIAEYDLEKISGIERNILRLGAYEILCDESIPSVVAISEGIRLCRKFATPEAAQFINGALDALYKNEEALKIPAK